MRLLFLTCLALTTTACAGGERPPMRHGPGAPDGGPGGFRRGGPDGGRGFGGGGRLFVSPMGEPFRAVPGATDPEDAWFAAADTNHDGMLSPAEFTADAMRFFAVLDRGHDGEIDPDDIDFYENDLLPEVRVGGGTGAGPRASGGGGGRRGGGSGGGGGGRRGGGGGGMGGGGMRGGGSGGAPAAAGGSAPQVDDARLGAARYGFFDYPEPLLPADTNYNRGISPAEFQAAADKRFAMLDRKGEGVLRLKDLPRVSRASFGHVPGMGRRSGGDRPRPERDDDE